MGNAKQPSGWTPVKLSRIIKKIDSGVSANGDGRPASCAEAGVLKVSAVTSGRFDPTQNKVVFEPSEKERLKCSVKSGDILMTRANGSADLVGACVYTRSDHSNLFLSDKIWKFIIEDTERDHSEWLYYLLSSAPLRQQIIDASSGSVGMRNVSKEGLLGISVARPPFPEQQKIAAILSTWDRAIELTEKLIAAKQKRKQALMQQLLTGKVRFKKYEGKPWKETTLRKLLLVRNEQIENDGTHPLYSLTIEKGVTPKTERYDREFLVRDTASKKYKIVYPGDIVFNPSNLRWGAIGIHHGTQPVLVSPIYDVLYIKSPEATDEAFLFQHLSSPRQIKLFAGVAEGTLVERTAVKLPTFLAASVLIPPSKLEQTQVAVVLGAIDREINLFSRRKESLSNQKKGLMQQLLTGKVRVNVDTETVKE